MRYLWQLPQHILGLIIILLMYLSRKVKGVEALDGRHVFITEPTIIGGVSLGDYIILDERYPVKEKYHELGHSRQSMLLGPLYLVVVGLPSIACNIISRFSTKWRQRYYTRFPENWADTLGNVTR